MPSLFPINPAALPLVSTRKALLIVDLQNDFVSEDGALPTVEPEGFVGRTLELVKAFRASGAGDVVWVRSEFEQHRPLTPEGDQIIVSDVPIRPNPARGRRPMARMHAGPTLELDEEAFLSAPSDSDKTPCVQKGTSGAGMPADVQAAVVADQDIVFTKTHYSAFSSEQQQLVQMLRGRFVTEMYICGALTNISIYATAIDAGRHGYDTTIVGDCCGFRSEIRHLSAIRQLEELTGSEMVKAADVITKLQPLKNKEKETAQAKALRRRAEYAAAGAHASAVAKRLALQSGLDSAKSESTGLSPTVSKMTLTEASSDDREDAASASQSSQPAGPALVQPQPSPKQAPRPAAAARNGSKKRSQSCEEDSAPADTQAPLEAQDDCTTDLGASEQVDESPLEPHQRRQAAQSARHGAANQSNPKAPSDPHCSADRSLAGAASPTEVRRVSIKPKRIRRTGSEHNSPAKPSHQSTIEDDTTSPRNSEPIDTPSETPDAKPQAPGTGTPADIETTAGSIMPQQQQQTAGAAGPTSSEPMCEGDTTVISNVLSPALAGSAFQRLLDEVSWAGMSHLGGEVPRRIAVQGAVGEDGAMPVYRHPSDEAPPLLPFSPTVLEIKTEIEKHLGHPLNHVLIQHYRSGNDYISEHSDKTLDIAKGSYIANVSLGAERTMIFRTKRPPKEAGALKKTAAAPTSAAASNNDKDDEDDGEAGPRPTESAADKAKRQVQRAPLPHNSLCRMGLATNMRWLHAIRQDKRADRDKSAAELAYGGARISLTFRQIATFLDASQARIWGQGATGKTRHEARDVINGQTPEAVRMLQAFGAENHSSDFDWAKMYGSGFDVLHMGTPKRFCAGTKDAVANMRVALALAELGISCAKGSVEGPDARFEDNDPDRAVVDGHETVLRYLDVVYGPGRRFDQMAAAEVAKRFVRLQQALDLLGRWRAAQQQGQMQDKDDKKTARLEAERIAGLIKKDMAEWEKIAEEAATTTTTTTAVTADATANEDGAETQQQQNDDDRDGRTKPSSSSFILGGSQPSPVDYALWPVLHDMVRECGDGMLQGTYLKAYYDAFKQRSAVGKILGGGSSATPIDR